MFRQKSLSKIILWSFWALSALLVMTLGFFWVGGEINRAEIKKREIHDVYLEQQKTTLKTEIDHIIQQINYKRSLLEQRAKTATKARTEEAYQTALYLYEQNKGKKSLPEIGKLIHDALFSTSWDDGKGYYFAEDMQGNELVNRNNPELEGKNIIDLQDSSGKYIMQEILSVARSEKKEGFCTYFWNRPDHPADLVPKISYVKYFAPLDWVIGTGLYLDDEENKIRKEVLDWVEKIRFTNDRYVFVGTFKGLVLTAPAKGRNMLGVADSNGKKIVQEFIAQAGSGGGFVEYVMPKLGEQRPAPKLSYVAAVPDWQWYIGTGIYIDYIDDAIAHEQMVSNQTVKKILIQIVSILGLFLLLSFWISWLFARRVQKNLNLFLRFFNKSATEKTFISPDKIFFHEFQSLALSANQMIEDRHHAWEELTAEQERLAVTLQSIGDGVMTTDTAGNVVLLNGVAEKLTGWTNEEALGQPVTEVFNIFNEKSGDKCLSPVQKVLDTGKVIDLANHTALRSKDGKQRSIADSGAPIKDKDGNILGVVLVFRDVTNEKKLEEELLKIRKLESVGVLAGGIAHDFNNLLAAILGNIELASRRLGPENKVSALLDEANNACNRAAKLTQQLLTFSKGGDPVKEATSLKQIVRESADFIIRGSQVSCTYDCPENLWYVEADSGQVGQVIQNIVLNAQQAMSDGGTIAISCSNINNLNSERLPSAHLGPYVKITITDSGSGIPAAVLDKIFDPYFTTKKAGSGLGLAICHSIINKHDGYIYATSVPGEGTTFDIYLPAILSVDKKVNDKNLNSPASTPQKLKIMVMDDEEIIRNISEAQLTHLGHEVVLVADGQEAIERYSELRNSGSAVDLIIMDLTIPGGMGGQEAVKSILELNSTAKVIVSSGYSNDPIMANYKDYGFAAAVTKPFDLNTISTAIASVF